MRLGIEWINFCKELHTGKSLYIYGVGKQCDFFYYVAPEESACIKGYFDTYKAGGMYQGMQVKNREAVAELPENSILLITGAYGLEIYADIGMLIPKHTSVYQFDGKLQYGLRWKSYFELTKMMADVRSQQLVFDLHAQYFGAPQQAGGTAPWYFNDEIFTKKPDGAYIDAGALFGETIINYITWMQGKYSKIYAFEPSAPNYEELTNGVLDEYDNIVFRNVALWNENTTRSFLIEPTEAGGAKVHENGEDIVQCVTLDMEEIEKVSMIKMDIEGAEWEALHGAENIIKRDKPDLAICLYHKPEDLYRIPRYIRQLVPEYKFSLRHHAMKLTEMVLYATVPDSAGCSS